MSGEDPALMNIFWYLLALLFSLPWFKILEYAAYVVAALLILYAIPMWIHGLAQTIHQNIVHYHQLEMDKLHHIEERIDLLGMSIEELKRR